MIIHDVSRMFDELCVKLGICLSPDDRAQIAITKFRDLDSLEVAVLHAEGLDPLSADRHFRHQLRDCLARYTDH